MDRHLTPRYQLGELDELHTTFQTISGLHEPLVHEGARHDGEEYIW